MSLAGIPQNLTVQTGNQDVLIQWNLVTGANTYKVQRSQDNVTFTDLATITGTPLDTLYLDSGMPLNIKYWYRVAVSSDSGVTYSSYTNADWAIPVPAGENSLGAMRLAAKQRADRVNSNFVTDPEWNKYIEKASYELYDLLITIYENYFMDDPLQFVSDGTVFWYPLPDGKTTFENGITGASFVPKAFYKLAGIDLALQNANNAYVTVNKFNFIDRNRFVYPNTASTIYGVFNLQYRVMGNKIMFIPTPSASQAIRVWYIPRLTTLLKDTDSLGFAISGWDEYVIVRAAKYALDKEESDTSKMDQELQFLTERITTAGSNRDEGSPDKISDTRSNNGWGSGNGGFNGAQGGF